MTERDAEAASADLARILIVEDEESLADSVRYNLEREGFAVVGRRRRRARDRAVPRGAARRW